MAVGIIIAIVIVVIIVLCVRQAVKGLQEAKERAMSKLGALMKRDESLELLNATPDTELETVQPASSDKKKLVRNLLQSEQLLTPTSSPGLFPQKMGGAPHPCFEGKALGRRLYVAVFRNDFALSRKPLIFRQQDEVYFMVVSLLEVCDVTNNGGFYQELEVRLRSR